MKLRSLILVLALLAPSIATADPITVGGSWSSTSGIPSADPSSLPLELGSFWSGQSWDGWHRGINYLLEEYGVTELEYLNDGSGNYTSFRFDEDIVGLTRIAGITSRTNSVLSVGQDGAFTYAADGFGVVNSWDDPGQFALFRIVLPETTHYFLGVEDMLIGDPLNDHDYNDYVARFEAHSVPEPGTLLLIGSGMVALAVRKKLASRNARTEAAV
jgi:hypothetical protein